MRLQRLTGLEQDKIVGLAGHHVPPLPTLDILARPAHHGHHQ